MTKQHVTIAAFMLSLTINVLAMLALFDLLAILGLLVGWYAADMASGVIHMYMDYRPCPLGKRLNDLFFYGGSRESEEYVGMFQQRMAAINPLERVVYDFKNHHPRPDALGRRDLWRLIGSTLIVAALPISLALNLALIALPVPGWILGFLIAFLIGGAFAQYFHATLHRESNPRLVTALRKLGLLMTPEAHQLHHNTLQRDFSTNCGWSNPVVNRLFVALRRRGHLSDAGLEPTS